MKTRADAFRRILEVLDRLEIPYFVAGSVASSVHASSFKFDIFPLLKDEYSQEQFRRRRFEETQAFGDEPIECAFATVEDTILNKLRWYRAGGGISEQQWNDLRGILQVSGTRLDLEYLRHWALRLGVADLLERLLGEKT